MSIIYFDNAASAKPCEEAITVFNTVIRENFANPASLHKGGIEAEKIITQAKATILSRILPLSIRNNADLIFTSGATESNNLAIIKSVKPRGKTKIVTTAIEHPGVDNAIEQLSPQYEIVRVPPEDLNHLPDMVDENTALVSMTAVCSETGFVVNTPKIYAEIKARFVDCIVHVDAAQGFLKVPSDGDLISISAHKIGGFPGLGGLVVKKGVRIEPMLFGGGQQKGIRAGTEPTALIAAFAAATAVERNPDVGVLASELDYGLVTLGMKINSDFRGNISVPEITNFSCGVKSEVMLHFLAEHGIYVSSGSACSRGKKSRVLAAHGIPDKDIDTAIRVSFAAHNRVYEVDTFLNILEKGLKRWK
ncbi:MAG: aminotransferase class V-fold PLP-dependent enzyme [Oscillospiraceae bacterium]|nr:aminotransferase class V-fold PLP-dependent enzyme [Oscillospiraceae bacterium]